MWHRTRPTVSIRSSIPGRLRVQSEALRDRPRTAAAVAERFALVEIESIKVKGKTEPDVIYTIVGRADTAQTPEFQSLRERWLQVLVCYRKQDWAGARQMLDACRDLFTQFGLVSLIETYRDRIFNLERNPPGYDWDGVFVAETK